MGYFPNGSSGEAYEARYCVNCLHYDGCPIWLAHLLYNYDECNNENSILHMLIPRTEDKLGNERCKFFTWAGPDRSAASLLSQESPDGE